MAPQNYVDRYELYKIMQQAYGLSGFDNGFSDSLLTPENFMRYYYKGEKYNDNGAVVVFTGKQYISVINANDGQQGHMHTYGRIHNAMKGIYRDIRMGEAASSQSFMEKNYLSLTFEAERNLKYKCIRVFYNGPISNEEYASFEAFYDQFADIIRKLGFAIWVRDRKEDRVIEVHNSIDELRDFMKSKVSNDKKPYELPEGEQIVGVPNNYSSKKRL